ncbi:uncharacterized protein LOC135826680 [Sycon ciliatum]|uniref:uncharacterized protein LOC135826680 n=1 Tax=Sycon ciliatum TaxID=27933 RepID=UPI0031F5FDDA
MAARWLANLEKTLSSKPEIRTAYNGVISSHLSKGYIRQVPDAEVLADKSDQWFLPHFPIVRQDKRTTKVRVVFDTAASWARHNINCDMHAGPKLQNDIVHILLRFSAESVALVGTSAKCSCDATNEPCKYEFNRLVFGLKSSPYLAGRALLQTAYDFSSDVTASADLVKLVEDSFNFDDTLHSFPTEAAALDAQQGLTELLGKSGFRLRKWFSNSPSVLQAIPEEDRAPLATVDVSSNAHCTLPSSKTLGITWLADRDQFTFVYHPRAETQKLTKRAALREVATIFDPRGQLTPFTMRARVLFQELCILGYE